MAEVENDLNHSESPKLENRKIYLEWAKKRPSDLVKEGNLTSTPVLQSMRSLVAS